MVDINGAQSDDKFQVGLLTKDGWKKNINWLEQNCSDFKAWRSQSDYQFRFVPLTNCFRSNASKQTGPVIDWPIEQHILVKLTGRPNCIEAHLPMKSQLNTSEWEVMLQDYWNQ